MSVNKQFLIGHIGQDPIVRHLEGGVTVANFSVATTDTWKNKAGEKVEQTEWHSVVAWRGQAEFIEKFARKGLMIYVEGKTVHTEYEKDGIRRWKTEVVASEVQMLTWPDKDTSTPQTSNLAAQNASTKVDAPKLPPSENLAGPEEDTELPF